MLAVGLFSLAATSLKAQIAINNSAATPNASAILDLQSGNTGVLKGFLPQSVSLTNVTTATITSPATGLIVYSPTAPTGGNGAGYYYWNGTAWASMNSNIYGSGINNYVARWTPNGTTLGTGLIQDNDIAVDVNSPYVAGAMLYSVTSSGIAAAGYTTDASSWGVGGYGQGGIGVYGAGSTYSIYGDATFYGAGSGGYFKDATAADYATIADNTNATGVTAYGTNYGVYGLSTANYDAGVYGRDDGWVGVMGVSTFGGGAGVAAYDSTLGGIGVYAYGGSYGVYGYGTTLGGYFYDGTGDYAEAAGAGVGLYAAGVDSGVSGYTSSGNSGVTGVSVAGNAVMGNGGYGGVIGYGQAYGAGGSDGLGDEGIIGVNEGFNIGGYFTDQGGDIAYVAYAGYGILSGGVKSTMVKDENNQNRVMYCNESPEVKFEDYGEGQLVNGKAHITLDPLLARNVTISQKHPLQAFVQLEGDCNGVYVTNKSVSGFDVVELNHGTSNTSFSWHIVANRAATVNKKGQTYDYANWRFPVGPDGSKISLVNPNKSAGKAVLKTAPKNIPAIADPKQSHKGTVVKQPLPIMKNDAMNGIGRASAQSNTQPNTQK